MASKGGYLDVVELLLDQNPNVNSIDQVFFVLFFFSYFVACGMMSAWNDVLSVKS